ncbi:MAG: hypothetical protein MJA29_14270 [Candidatus Omnitrophica bacterium]|nr:hypothetical protein [Candidatus Omnitrophota bacterium]
MTAVYLMTFVLAACSMLYELVIAQTLSFLSGDTVTRYCLTIGLYLAGMGCGAFFSRRLFRRAHPWSSLFRVEVLLSCLGGCAVLLLSHAHSLFCYLLINERAIGGVAVFFFFAALLILTVGFVTGLELPLLLRLSRERAGGGAANRVLAADYFGSLVAAAGFGLFLVQRMEMLTLGFAAALANTGVALFILLYALRKDRFRMRLALSALLFAAFLFGIFSSRAVQQGLLKRYYYHHIYSARLGLRSPGAYFTTGALLPRIERYRSPYQKIDLVHLPRYSNPFAAPLIPAYSRKFKHDPGFPRDRVMFLNGNFQFWSDYEEIYHEYFTHVPVILNRHVPRSVLVLGAGDGLLVRELLKYKEIEEITVVELDERVVRLARTHPVFRAVNKDSLSDERVRVVIADAYYYLRSRRGAYDAVYIDFPDPSNYDLAKLYSVEFYRMLLKHLAPGGYAVLDAPGIASFSPVAGMEDIENVREYPLEAALNNGGGLFETVDDRAWITHYHTLSAAGFGTIRPYVSNLEIENPAAAAAIDSLVGRIARIEFREKDLDISSSRVLENKADISREVIRQHVRKMQTGFIMVKKERMPLELRYLDFGIAAYVLNERRFNLAFALPFAFPDEIDERFVNSITRPRFPTRSFWYIKTAL